ncbi:MAG: signal peptidase II [Rickettsiales bacterium]|nr:signal peptidase II [Rickettsiales bacterium]
MLYKLLGILGIIIADQAIKTYLIWLLARDVVLVAPGLELIPQPVLFARANEFFNLIFTWNPGTSFSMLTSVGETAPWAIAVLTAAIIGFLTHRLFVGRVGRIEDTALVLIIGGALGNLIDRIRFGAVVDFLDFHWGVWHWPAFNFADIFICLGIAVYFYGLIKRDWYGKK